MNRTRGEHDLAPAGEPEGGAQSTEAAVDPLAFEPDDAESVLRVIDRARSLAITDLSMAMAVSAELVERVAASSPARPRVLSLRAVALSYRSDFVGALSVLEEAAALLDEGQIQRGAEYGHLQLAKVQPLARLGRLAEAEQAAVLACGCLHGTPQWAKAQVNLGIVLRMRGRAPEALAAFADAAPGLAGDAGATAALQSNRAEALLDMDRLADAADAFEQAFESFCRAGMDHGAAIVEGNLADLLARRGLTDESISRFESARARFERVGATADAARLTGEQAEALRLAGAPRKAARLYALAIERLKVCGLARELARAKLGLSQVFAHQGNHARALELLTAAADAARGCGDQSLAADCVLAAAESLTLAGRYAEAAPLVTAAAGAFHERPLKAAFAQCVSADLALASGDAAGALRIASGVGQLAGSLGVTPLRVRAIRVCAAALVAMGDRHAAIAVYEEAMRLTELFRSSLGAEQVRTASLESAGALYVQASTNLLEIGSQDAVASVFTIIERVRARTLLEAIGRRGAATSPGHRAADRCADLLAELDSLYARLDGGGRALPVDEAGGPALLAERTRLAEARLEREVDLLRANAPADVHNYATPLRLECAVRRVEQGVMIASYFRDGDWISALVVQHGHARVVRRLVMAARAATLSRRIWLAAEAASAGALHRSDRETSPLPEVAALLIDPLIGTGEPVSRLAVSLCREMHALPICAAASFAASDVSCCLTPSVSAALLEPTGCPEPGGALVVGVPDQLAPDMERESWAVAALLPGGRTLIGAEAVADRVLRELPGAAVAHLACHALYDDEFPMSSRLRLADRWVTARELMGAIRPGALVVLSGCDTGRSPEWTGEDRYGLVRAVLASGASAAVSSLWRLHDETAAAAFGAFYASLSQAMGRPGFAAAHALSASIRAMNRDKVPWPYWAGLTVKGVAL